MRVLVTGANGFLGRHIVEQLLARGDTVRCLCRRNDASLQNLGTELVLADIRERDKVMAACRGVDTVMHVAAVAGIWGSWEHFYSTNTQGTEHVIAGCRQHGVARLIYTSSPSVTFDGTPQEGIDESAPYASRWLCHYPHTKALAEQAVLSANGEGALLTCSLRPHLIWGPHDRHLVPRLIQRARTGQLRRVGEGSNLIDTIYVENAARAHLQAAQALMPGSPLAGKAYFLSQDQPVLLWEWVDRLLALADLPPVKRSVSLRAAYTAGAILEAGWKLLGKQSEPRMTRFLALQLGLPHYFDIGRAKQDFGYTPAVSTADGMARLGAWLAGSTRSGA